MWITERSSIASEKSVGWVGGEKPLILLSVTSAVACSNAITCFIGQRRSVKTATAEFTLSLRSSLSFVGKISVTLIKCFFSLFGGASIYTRFGRISNGLSTRVQTR